MFGSTGSFMRTYFFSPNVGTRIGAPGRGAEPNGRFRGKLRAKMPHLECAVCAAQKSARISELHPKRK
jgi:hypothetical protein